MSLITREIKNDDFELCSEMYTQIFSSSPWSEKWNKYKAYERLIHFYNSEGFIGLVAEENNGIIGFVLGNTEPFLDTYWYYLREMCITPKSQGKGSGTHLLKQLNDVLLKKSVKNIYLATDRNFPAAMFYEKNNFTQVKNMGFYYREI